MNKKLVVVLFSTLGLILLIGAVYLGWEYKKITSTPTLTPTPTPTPTLTITKEMEQVLNGTYIQKYQDGTRTIKFIDGSYEPSPINPDVSNRINIEPENIVIVDINDDGVEDAIFVTTELFGLANAGSTGEVFKILNVAEKKNDSFTIYDFARFATSTGAMGNFPITLNFKNGIIELGVERQTGCTNVPSKLIVQKYKYLNGQLERLDKKEITGPIEIEILSPKKGDVWKKGEPHKIVLSQPWPFELNCANLIQIKPTGTSYSTSNFNWADLSDKNGAVIALKEGISEYTWDGEHAYGYTADENGVFYDENGNAIKDIAAFSLAPGTYSLSVSSEVTDQPVYVRADSESFQLVE